MVCVCMRWLLHYTLTTLSITPITLRLTLIYLLQDSRADLQVARQLRLKVTQLETRRREVLQERKKLAEIRADEAEGRNIF